MTIYIINFAVNMILGLLLVPRKRNYDEAVAQYPILAHGKKIYLIITAIQLGLLCGFRSTTVAYDTWAYEEIFNNAPKTFDKIFKNQQYVEIGFSILCSLIKIFGGSFQVLLIITSMFTMGSCCLFIYRHSDDVLMSVFTIMCFPFFYSSFDIIRHFLALSFLLIGYKYVVQRKFFKFLICILLGSLFHSIALIFIFMYFIPKLKFNESTVIITGVVVAISFIWMEDIVEILGKVLGKDYSNNEWFGSYGGGTRTAVMYLVIFLIALVLFYNLKQRGREEHTAVCMIMGLLCFAILFINARMMTRFIMSAIPFLAIAIPRLLSRENTHRIDIRNVCFVGYTTIGIAYHAYMLMVNWQNVVPYTPFWA